MLGRPAHPSCGPFSLGDGPGGWAGGSVCFSRLFGFQKPSEEGVNGRQEEASQRGSEGCFQWGCQRKHRDKRSCQEGVGEGLPFPFQSPDDGHRLALFFWEVAQRLSAGGAQPARGQWAMPAGCFTRSPHLEISGHGWSCWTLSFNGQQDFFYFNGLLLF